MNDAELFAFTEKAATAMGMVIALHDREAEQRVEWLDTVFTAVDFSLEELNLMIHLASELSIACAVTLGIETVYAGNTVVPKEDKVARMYELLHDAEDKRFVESGPDDHELD